MPSIIHNIVLAAFRAGLVPSAMEYALNKDIVFRQPPTDRHVSKFNVTVGTFQDYPLYTYGEPEDGQPILYYAHGGGFLAGMFKAYFDALGPFSKKLDFPMIVPDYPMPGEVDALAMRQWTFDHFTEVRKAYPNSKIIVGGDSAGANLALALAQDLGGKAKEQIQALFLLYGWFDLTRTEADYPQNKEEVLLRADGIVGAAERFRGALDAKDPRISPFFGDLSQLPPVHMISADKDMLFADSGALEDALNRVGQSFTHHNYQGYAHDFWLLPTPDGRRAMRDMADDMNKVVA